MIYAARLVSMDGAPASAEEMSAAEVAFYDASGSNTGRIDALEASVAALQAELLLRTRWMGTWVDGPYEARDQVLDDGWLAIANKATSERPAPQPQGEETWLYDGASPRSSISAKELIVAQRYQFPSANFVNGWRSDEVAGYSYRAFVVIDPDGIAQVDLLSIWTATSTGRTEHLIIPKLFPAGTDFELGIGISEPDPSPTTWTGDWNYILPQNETDPGPGECTQATKVLDQLKFNYLDDNAGDRTAELQALLPGDKIVGAGQTWSIQVATQETGFISFTVAPAQQGAPAGVTNFSFETVTATDISIVLDTDYFAANSQISGKYSVNNGPPVVTQDAYDVDIFVQQASISLDWDLQ